ncbi:thioesterase superfamily protein [Xylaria intraflava]|nr:thioesterase superfamily protein [Xylaria intraflava]
MSTSDYAHFVAIPWCARHLQGDRIVARSAPCRALKTTTQDSLLSDTLNSDRAVSKMIQVYEEPILPSERVDQLKTFVTLGSGLNGHPDVCHGGIVVALLDEAVGSLGPLNRKRKSMPDGAYMTAYLNTSFVKPVSTPTTILVRSWFTSVQGRKYFSEGTIEDESGTVLARAEALFVLVRSPL